jgi:hypothetical protein
MQPSITISKQQISKGGMLFVVVTSLRPSECHGLSAQVVP